MTSAHFALAIALSSSVGSTSHAETFSAAKPAAGHIYVVTSAQPAFTDAAQAAMKALGDNGILLRADESGKTQLERATLVVAVGPLAARFVAQTAPLARVVSCLTPKASVPVRASPDEVLGMVRMLMPSVKKVGVFSTRPSTELARAAGNIGLAVVLPTPDEPFASAVDRLVASSDALWIDEIQAVPESGAALVVKRASERRKHVVGPNRASVLQGAYFAVVPDPATHGRAAAEAALGIARGDDVDSVAAPPGHIVLNGALTRAFSPKLSAAAKERTEVVE